MAFRSLHAQPWVKRCGANGWTIRRTFREARAETRLHCDGLRNSGKRPRFGWSSDGSYAMIWLVYLQNIGNLSCQ